MTHHLAEEDVPRGRQRQGACLRDDGAGAADVGLVELERCAELHDRGCRVPDRRQPVADLVVGKPCVHPPRVDEHGLEHRTDLVGAALEEVGVEAFEPWLGPAVRSAIRRKRAGEGSLCSGTDVRACLGHM